MNIVIVTAMFPPIRTGTSFYSRNLARELAKRGHNVTVVTADNKDSLEKEGDLDVYRIPSMHFPLKNYFKHLRFCSLYPGNYLRLNSIVKKKRADVILLINHYLDIAFPAIFASVMNRIPLLVSVGTQLHSADPVKNRILNMMDRIICGHMVFPFCHKIISWDMEIQRYLVNVNGPGIMDKSVIVPYGVNGDINEFLGHRHDYSNRTQVLGVGSVIEQRDFVHLVKVFGGLLRYFPDLKLKIIGHVYYDAAVRLSKDLGLGDKVEFTGELSHDEVLGEMQRSILFNNMLSANYFGLGTASLEAMLLGIPILSNVPEDLFGSRLLQDMETFISTDGTTVEPAVQKVKAMLTDLGLAEKIGQNGRKFVLEHLHWDVVSRKMEQVLEEAVRNTR